MALTRAVLLAGGRGTRLAPYTSVLPKPLMPVGDQSVLEVVVGQLAESGVTRITMCVGYLSHLIRAIFDNGAAHGVDLDYVQEAEPLGTAGPLRLVEGLTDTFLVMNGDILTTLDYSDLLRFHRERGNVMTIASHRRTVKIDYGVLKHDVGSQLVGFEEKPEVPLTVSMGIYVMEPEVLDLLPEEGRFEFPDLVQAALDDDRPVGVYLFDGLWFDIGRHDDYTEAIEAWNEIDHALRTELEAVKTRAGHTNGHPSDGAHHIAPRKRAVRSASRSSV